MGHLSRAVTSQHEPVVAAEHAERAISRALDLSDRLMARYVKKVVATRHRAGTKLQAVLGGNLGPSCCADRLRGSFFRLSMRQPGAVEMARRRSSRGTYHWEIADRQIEWCHENGLPVIGGPLLQLDDRGLPDWLAIWQGDFDNILAFVSDYVETAVQRYVGKVSLWQCALRREYRRRARAVGRGTAAAGGVHVRDRPQARPDNPGDSFLRSAVGRIHGRAPSATCRPCILPTSWCGRAWIFQASAWN